MGKNPYMHEGPGGQANIMGLGYIIDDFAYADILFLI
jgi:hypothetical protein